MSDRQRERIIWARPDFEGAALHGFRKTGEASGKRIYKSLCGAIVMHRKDRLEGQAIFDSGVCSECMRARTNE